MTSQAFVSSRRRLLAACLAAFLVATVSASPAWAARAITRIVAVTGDPTPNGEGIFSSLNLPVLNDTGEVAFRGWYGGSPSGDGGIFRSSGNTLVQIAHSGQALTSGDGVVGNLSVSFPGNNDAGQAAFRTGFSGTPGHGIFRGDGTELVEIVRAFQSAPDGDGHFISFNTDVPTVALNNAQQVLFTASLRDTDNRSGLFIGDGDTIVQVARSGQSVLGGNGILYGVHDLARLNENGQVAFRASVLNPSGEPSPLNPAIIRSDGASLIAIARAGQPAPNGNGEFSDIGLSLALNDAGQVAFSASLSNTSDGTDGQRIFRGDGTELVEIVRAGQMMPGGSGLITGFVPPNLSVNNAGKVVFVAQHIVGGGGRGGGGGAAIIRGDGTSLTEIARSGQVGPGGEGLLFLEGGGISRPVLNEAGQVAFMARLVGSSGGLASQNTILLHDDALGLTRVASVGDNHLDSTITALAFGSMESPFEQARSLNKTGTPRIAYRFLLADGRQGIAVWTLVPEPGGYIAAATAMVTIALMRRRRDGCAPTK